MAIDTKAALGFVASQATHIERQVNEAEHPDIVYSQLVPVDTSANPFAPTVTYLSADRYGRAEWIDGNADDIPIAGTERAAVEKPVYMAGIGYGYGYAEIEQARMLGVPLRADDALAARRAYEEFVDRLALLGNTSKGLEGLLNHSQVTTSPAVNGDWTNADADEILEDVNAAIQLGNNKLANTLLLPADKLRILASKVIRDRTAISFIRENNLLTSETGGNLLIRGLSYLEEAVIDTGGDTSRLVAYRRDPLVLKLHIPMPHRFLPVYQAGPLRFEVPGVFRVGGLDIRDLSQIVYVDGI